MRSRVKWLQYGDRNTKFFCQTAIQRRQGNKVLCLKVEDGSWIKDEGEVTRLKCGGFIFAIRLKALNHIMSDAFGLTQLMSTFGNLAHGKVPFILPMWERHFLDALDPPESLSHTTSMANWKAPTLRHWKTWFNIPFSSATMKFLLFVGSSHSTFANAPNSNF
ncbi:hypothetical protein REPUB_Repub16aG0072300 [Reevesia pubescens]